MAKYISFLRGINVGGHKLIKMEDLKEIYTSAGFKDVRTFIQSGNVLFSSGEKDSDKLNRKIEKHLLQSLGYGIETFTRSETELADIMDNNPFRDIEIDRTVKVYITFMNNEPSENARNSYEVLSYNAEKFIVIKREVYTLVYKNKIKDKPLFSANFLEKKLGVKATTRDLTTMNKIRELI